MFICPKCRQPVRIVGRYADMSTIVICHQCLVDDKKESMVKLDDKKHNMLY